MSKLNVVDNKVNETIYLTEGQPSPNEGILISITRYNELKNIETQWHDARESVKAFLDGAENPVSTDKNTNFESEDSQPQAEGVVSNGK